MTGLVSSKPPNLEIPMKARFLLCRQQVSGCDGESLHVDLAKVEMVSLEIDDLRFRQLNLRVNRLREVHLKSAFFNIALLHLHL